jgi:glycosyl transferase, family 25
MNIYVVNLDRHPDRLASIEQQLTALDLSYFRVAAVDGSKLSKEELDQVYDPVLCKRSCGRELARGEIGCAMSHLSIYKQMVASQIPLACVLEDDAQLSEKLPQVLEALEYLAAEQEPVVSLLTHVGRYTAWGAKTLSNADHQICKTVHAFCTHGYVINHAAARALLKHNQKINHPLDYWNDFSSRGVLQVRAVVPYVVGHSGFAMHSEIETERMALSQDNDMLLSKSVWQRCRTRVYDKFFYELIKPLMRIRKQHQTF